MPPDISAEEAFALMLETACEDFEILQALIDGEIQVAAPKSNEATPANKPDHRKAHRAVRAAPVYRWRSRSRFYLTRVALIESVL
jgi:hypothetical protein